MMLAYWLLEHFDHLRCSLKLPNGVEVVVHAKDVELILVSQMRGLHLVVTELPASNTSTPVQLKRNIYSMQTKVLEMKMLQET